MSLAASLAVGLVPVLAFLAGLRALDSFKLVPGPAVGRALAAGALAAALALAFNRLAVEAFGLDPALLKRLVAPLVEECLKAAYVAWLVRAERVGFTVDAAIHGFAAGTGFAVFENVWYAHALAEFNLAVWIVRGLGTAVMHGSTTAVFAILAKQRAERRGAAPVRVFVPGLALAFGVHAFFNQIVLNPLLMTGLLLVAMPALVVVVYERSERATHDWLAVGFDSDVDLLEAIESGEVSAGPVGRYLDSLHGHFPGAVVADMLCLLRIHLELALRAKGILIARAAGVDVPEDERIRANFAELGYLKRSIGPAGMLAILPFLRTNSRDLWQIHLLRDAGRRRGRRRG